MGETKIEDVINRKQRREESKSNTRNKKRAISIVAIDRQEIKIQQDIYDKQNQQSQQTRTKKRSIKRDPNALSQSFLKNAKGQKEAY